MSNFKGTVKDYRGERDHHYPCKEENKKDVRMHFDFIFSKEGEWFYVSSSSDANAFERMKLHHPIEEKDEHWKVVNALSGQIVKESS